MKTIHEIRRHQAWEAQKSASPLPIIVGAVIAFGIGLLGVSGVIRVPTVLHAKMQQAMGTPNKAGTDGKRIGSAEAAPLRKVCVRFARQNVGQDAGRGDIWGEIADCVYRQNGWVLCDPDNRAFAVEAASTFIRQLAAADRTEKFIDSRNIGPFGLNADQRTDPLPNSDAVRGRVLSGIRAQVAEGRLTASDFGMLVPSEITQIIRETGASRDACAAGN